MILEFSDDLLTPDQLCEIFSIGKNKAYELLRTKQIKAFKIGHVWKIPKESVENYITQSCE